MARGAVTFTFERGLFEGFATMKRRAKNTRAALTKLRGPLQRDLKAHAKSQDSPDGSWPKRSKKAAKRAAGRKATVRRGRTRGASKTRGARSSIRFIGGGNLLGKLPDTVIVRSRNGELSARSPVPWSGIHNEGGRAGRGSKIPARPFVFLSPKISKLAAETLNGHLLKGWRKRGR